VGVPIVRPASRRETRQWGGVVLKGCSSFCCSPSDHTPFNVGKVLESIARIGCPTETRLFRVRVDPVSSPTRRIWLGYLRGGRLLGAEGGCGLVLATPFARSSKPSAIRRCAHPPSWTMQGRRNDRGRATPASLAHHMSRQTWPRDFRGGGR
jgi:hypothetical protein